MGVFSLVISPEYECGISVKRAGDIEERFVSYGGGEVTFNSVNDGFEYDYILKVSCPYNPVIERNFKFKCLITSAGFSLGFSLGFNA